MRMYLFIADDGGIAMFSYTQDRKHYLIYQLLNESYHFQTSMIPILTHFNIFFINHKKQCQECHRNIFQGKTRLAQAIMKDKFKSIWQWQHQNARTYTYAMRFTVLGFTFSIYCYVDEITQLHARLGPKRETNTHVHSNAGWICIYTQFKGKTEK